jgi:hypothetical protein
MIQHSFSLYKLLWSQITITESVLIRSRGVLFVQRQNFERIGAMTTACQTEAPVTAIVGRLPADAKTVSEGHLYVLKDRIGSTVTVRRGQLWITQENDARDIILNSGESFTLERAGKAILQGMPCAHFDIR